MIVAVILNGRFHEKLPVLFKLNKDITQGWAIVVGGKLRR